VKSPIAENIWFGIQPISAGLWGVPLGFAVIIIVSLLTPKPEKEVQDLVEHVCYPNLEGDAAFQANLNRPGGQLAPVA
jgi:cation/acetate symporter